MSNERTAVIRTHCKDCVFNIKINDEQKGCKLDRLATFIEQGTKMDLVDGSYIIHKLCAACRNEEWAATKDNIMYAIKEELEVKIDYIVICNEVIPNISKIKHSLWSIEQQDITPNSIIVSVKNDGDNIYHTLSADYSNIKVVHILDDDNIVDNCVKKCTGMYYTVINAGDELNSHYSYIVDYLINDRLELVTLILEHEDLPTLYHLKTHRLLSGNYHDSLVNKIQHIAKDQNNSKIIKKWEDVVRI